MSGFAIGRQDPGFDDFAPQAIDEPVPFWDAVNRNWNDSLETRRDGVREETTEVAFWARHREIERRLGRKLKVANRMVNDQPDADRDALSRGLDWIVPVPTINAMILGLPGAMSDRDYEAMLEEERRKNPQVFEGIERTDEMLSRLDRQWNVTRARADAAYNSPGGIAGGVVGQIGGAMVDPPNMVMALVTGPAGAGRPLLGRLMMQGGVGALTEALQVPGRMSDARYGGPKYTLGEGAQDVTFGAIGGVGFELLGTGLRGAWRHSVGRGFDSPVRRGMADVIDRGLLDEAILGDVDGELYDAGLDALDTGAPPPRLEPARDLGDLFPASPGPLGEQGAVAIAGEASYRGRRIVAASFDPDQLEADPVRFQYKADGDAEGVTARLRGVEAWDATASGKVIVFEEKGGRLVVADGHQRRGLAQRMKAKGWDARLDGYLFREADGWTSRQVRTIAALKNIREGSGSILDAAKIFRDAPDAALDPSLPVTGDFMAQARGLSRLSSEAFGAVVNKVIPERYGAIIGETAHARPDLHPGLVKLMREAEPANADEARALVQEALLDDWIKADGVQTTLFGDLAPEATTIARAKVKAAVLQALRRDARIFNQLVKHADAIEAGGNTLARDANQTAAAVSAAALSLLSKLALRSGEIGEAMALAARKVIAGEKPGLAARGLVQRVKTALAEGERIEGVRLETINPEAPSPAAQQLLDGFDDPHGAAARGQAEAKPEEADLETDPDSVAPGLFDDLEDEAAPLEALHGQLAACAPGGPK